MEIRYNYLNLPETIAFETGDFIEYTYDASGIKLSKLFYLGRRRIQTDYLNGFHYENNELQFFPTPEGYVSRRVEQGQQSFDYVYQYRDHLTNESKACLCTKFASEALNVMSYKRNPNDDWLDLLDQNHYYPFGLRHEGYNFTIIPNPSLGFTKNHYKYNNKELQTELNLNLYDYGARNYYPTIGRWFSVDPLAEHPKQVGTSPYVYAANNPIRYIDPTGLIWEDPKQVEILNKSINNRIESIDKNSTKIQAQNNKGGLSDKKLAKLEKQT